MTLAESLDADGRRDDQPDRPGPARRQPVRDERVGFLPGRDGLPGVRGHGPDGAATFQVYVAELPEDVDVADLADAAASVNDQSALYDGLRLIVLSPQPDFEDLEDEDEA